MRTSDLYSAYYILISSQTDSFPSNLFNFFTENMKIFSSCINYLIVLLISFRKKMTEKTEEDFFEMSPLWNVRLWVGAWSLGNWPGSSDLLGQARQVWWRFSLGINWITWYANCQLTPARYLFYHQTGEITLNGDEREAEQLRRMSSYIPDEEIIFNEVTTNHISHTLGLFTYNPVITNNN